VIHIGTWWSDTEVQLHAEAMIVPVICASHKTHLTNVSDDQRAWLLYPMIGNIRKNICCTPKLLAWILVGLNPSPPKGAKNTDKVGHSAAGTVLTPLRNLDITGPGLKWYCGDGYQ
jgi:hypothetical protein